MKRFIKATSNVTLSLFIVLFVSCGDGKNSTLHNNLKIIPMKHRGYTGKYVYIDMNGNQVFDEAFHAAEPFSEGLAKVRMDDGWYFINEKGKVVIDASQYRSVTNFSEGIAWATSKLKETYALDKKGNVLFELVGRAEGLFHDGLAAFKLDKYGKTGFVDETGKIVIEPEWESATYRFSNGLSCVFNGNGKFGAINTRGKLVIDYLFDSDFTFDSNGCAVVNVRNERGHDRFGLIDKKGKFLIEPGIYTHIYPDDEWYKIAMEVDGKELVGWCDKNGKLKIKPFYPYLYLDSHDCFFQGDKWVYVPLKEGKCFIDRKGKIVSYSDYSVETAFFNDRVIVSTRQGYQLMNRKGELIGDEGFDDSYMTRVGWRLDRFPSFDNIYSN